MVDHSDLASVIRESPAQLARGLQLAADVTLPAWKVSRLLVAGMGGSALPSDFLALRWGDAVRIDISRDYELVPPPDASTLVAVCSYSGTTEETLAALEQAHASGAPCIALSHGGTLAARAAELGIPHIELPLAIMPRYAGGYFLGALAGVLGRLGLIADPTDELTQIGRDLLAMDLSPEGHAIASAIGTVRTPIVLAWTLFGSVARNWKIKINENAKSPAYWNVLPEMNHNEMVGYTKPRFEPAFILLQRPNDPPRIAARFAALADLMRGRGHVVLPVMLPQAAPLAQALHATLLGDWVSYHLAIESGVDPTPIDLVEDFKVAMRDRQHPTQP